ncbi:MAG: hypothetical protein B6I36_03330 [Desulfobacteraceae bacterium 4572_35.1]|nr:MAG: hypothetical protein B6I36_03330 [Desulfobacteraceae bacterium 4572_35.1]
MPFKHILQEIVSSDLGVCSAIIADWEGEAVDWLSSGKCDEDIKLFGAHLGILLNQLCRAATSGGCDEVKELSIRLGNADWFVFPVTSEYYLAVAATCSGQRAKICHVARRCLPKLLNEIV